MHGPGSKHSWRPVRYHSGSTLCNNRQGHEYHLITRKDVAFNVGIRIKLYVYRISARAVHGLPEFNLMPRNQSLHNSNKQTNEYEISIFFIVKKSSSLCRNQIKRVYFQN